MNGHTVITIGRETGSGGHHIGEMLAERLGVKYYDKELLTLAAKESGYCEEIFESYDEKPNRSFLFSTVMDTYSLGGIGSSANLPLNHKVFLAQFDAIKNLAMRESCVMIGRCADYALAGFPNTTTIFITGDMEDKVSRIARIQNLTRDKAKDYIVKSDKKRANYYNYYTSKEWGKAASYDLSLNSSKLGYEGVVELILEYLQLKDRKLRDEE